jgi:phage protein D
MKDQWNETGERKSRRVQPQPDYRITLDGRDLSPLIAPRLISLALTERRADEADMIDLALDDADGRLAIPKRGAVVRVAIGWRGQSLVDKGTFTVDEIEHRGAPDIVTIRARSASMTNAMRERRERSWHRQTLGAIVHAIAARHGLKPAVAHSLASIAIAHIDQTHESDMSFLTRLAWRYDAVMTVKDGHLLFMPIGAARTVSGKPFDVLRLSRGDGDRHCYHVARRAHYTAVRAYWHSNAQATRNSVVVGDGVDGNMKVLPQDYANEAEARAAAGAAYTRVQRSQATMDYTLALGRPELRPEVPMALSGFKPEIDATPWLVKGVTHTIDDGGFTSAIELEVRACPSESCDMSTPPR